MATSHKHCDFITSIIHKNWNDLLVCEDRQQWMIGLDNKKCQSDTCYQTGLHILGLKEYTNDLDTGKACLAVVNAVT